MPSNVQEPATLVTANSPAPDPSSIAGSVLPIERAEELLATLPGVISVRVIAGPTGSVDEIHMLTTTEVGPKQTVRNVESALIAHLGLRVSHKKISVATTTEVPRAPIGTPAVPVATIRPSPSGGVGRVSEPRVAYAAPAPAAVPTPGRRLYFEDVEVRRSRSKGIACKVTLKKGDDTFIGEAEGFENERLRIELAARACVAAIEASEQEDGTRAIGLEGARIVEAFDRQFVFVGLTARMGRGSVLLTGSAEIKESAETASVLAVLDATNRWIDHAV
jgi:hypothetical protein